MELRLRGRVAPGVVVEVAPVRRANRVAYRFTLPTGARFTGEDIVARALRPGDGVEVHYLEDEPTRSCLETRVLWPALGALFAVVMLAGIPVVVVLARRRKRGP